MENNIILTAMERLCLQGNAFASEQELYHLCCRSAGSFSYKEFHSSLVALLHTGQLYLDRSRLYLSRIWRQEDIAARRLVSILHAPPLPPADIPSALQVGALTLTDEKRDAVALALSHRLSLVLAGAGSGKTTLIRAIVDSAKTKQFLLCAPTGKAARNLTDRTSLPAETIHSALHIMSEDAFTEVTVQEALNLIIVDEASMLTIGMLAGLLLAAPEDCRIVLLGDPNQLSPVGAGDVLPDLQELGVPCICLTANHRQSVQAGALCRNVVRFDAIHSVRELLWDNSFQFLPYENDGQIADAVSRDAADLFLAGSSVQVLSPRNSEVDDLNQRIRQHVNPPSSEKSLMRIGQRQFVSGDRVILSRNDRARGCCNGDIGVFSVCDQHSFTVDLGNGRRPRWCNADTRQGLASLKHAYAITAHKSQGSEYDVILMPMTRGSGHMFCRSLFYTAISRAKYRVVLYGDIHLLEQSLQAQSPERRSTLVEKVHDYMEHSTNAQDAA